MAPRRAVGEWTVEEVCDWLQELGMHALVPTFRDNAGAFHFSGAQVCMPWVRLTMEVIYSARNCSHCAQ